MKIYYIQNIQIKCEQIYFSFEDKIFQENCKRHISVLGKILLEYLFVSYNDTHTVFAVRNYGAFSVSFISG